MIVFTFVLTVGLYIMAKQNTMTVKDLSVRTLKKDGVDYICITDIARQKDTVAYRRPYTTRILNPTMGRSAKEWREANLDLAASQKS